MNSKEKRKIWQKEYYKKNSEKRRAQQHNYYKKNREQLKRKMKIYNDKNKDKHALQSVECQKRNRRDWKTYFISQYGNSPICQICGKKLGWLTGIARLSVHFDHRWDGQETIKRQPTGWLATTPCILENIRIFESCCFGILCGECNIRLPTKNRIRWLTKAIKYTQKISKRR